MKKSQLQDLFVMELQDIYSAEQQIVDALPRLMDAANRDVVKSAFQEHLLETEGQIERLEAMSEQMAFEIDLEGEMCEGMERLKPLLRNLV